MAQIGKKGRVLVAMSGGVDSSMAALMLKEEGYEVIGLTMKTWDYAHSSTTKKETGCCSLDAINDAREVAMSLEAPHYVIDIRESFGTQVIDYFETEYLAGRTPNPCVMCNTHVKWDVLLQKADVLDCTHVATGHYAKLRKEGERYILSRSKDQKKDQSYALWGVSQHAFSRTLFPMANYTKAEVKARAMQAGFQQLVKKTESYEICFIPENDYRAFLRKRLPHIDKQIGPGTFVLTDGTEVGTHQGYPFYTIGQRRGLGLALGYPSYVVAIDKENNRIVVGTQDELTRNSMQVVDMNWIKYASLQASVPANVQIRYNDRPGTPAQLTPTQSGHIDVLFGTQVIAITPGQAAVFYEGEDVLGGGWIRI